MFKNLRIAIALILPLVFCASAQAGYMINSKNLVAASNDTVISTYPVGTSTVTSKGVHQPNNEGYSNLLVVVPAGSVTVDIQVSQNGTTYYDPYTTDGSSLTDASQIVTGLTASRWITLSAKMAPYVRFVFTGASADTVISATYIYLEQD